MIYLAWLNAFFLWGCAVILGFHTIKHWKILEKRINRYSELVESGLFILIGYYMLTLFSTENVVSSNLYLILFISNSIIFLWFMANVIPNCIKKRIDSSFRKDISYEKFIDELRNKYENSQGKNSKDSQKDFSRKILHFIQFFGYLIFHELSVRYILIPESWGISALEFRNFIYLLVACFFWIMMMIGDITRMENFNCLPKWGMTWFRSSLNYKKEQWTLNGVTPILLANFVWIHPSVPIQVFLIAAWVSCVSDAVASIVGKNIGNHKWGEKTAHPKKSLEGTIAGVVSTIIGIMGVILLYPFSSLPVSFFLVILIGNGVIFFLIDVFGKYFVDNLPNSLLTGAFTWGSILVFEQMII